MLCSRQIDVFIVDEHFSTSRYITLWERVPRTRLTNTIFGLHYDYILILKLVIDLNALLAFSSSRQRSLYDTLAIMVFT